MNVSSIGVQQILPQSGIVGPGNAPAQDQNSGERDNPAPPPDRAPAEPGAGQVVDKLA